LDKCVATIEARFRAEGKRGAELPFDGTVSKYKSRQLSGWRSIAPALNMKSAALPAPCGSRLKTTPGPDMIASRSPTVILSRVARG
jgi:hypothetical protein